MTGEPVPSSLTSPNLDILPVPRTLLLAAWGTSSREQPGKLAEPQIVDVEKEVAIVGQVMSLLLNMLSKLVITFLPRRKCLLISWLHSPSAVILEPPKIKSDPVSTVSPSISHEVMGPDAMIFVF